MIVSILLVWDRYTYSFCNNTSRSNQDMRARCLNYSTVVLISGNENQERYSWLSSVPGHSDLSPPGRLCTVADIVLFLVLLLLLSMMSCLCKCCTHAQQRFLTVTHTKWWSLHAGRNPGTSVFETSQAPCL